MKCSYNHEGFISTFSILFISSLCCFLPVAFSSSGEVENETPFTYIEGTCNGPKHWGHLNPNWTLCETGKLQSPIDLLSGKLHFLPYPGKLKTYYKPAPAVVKNRGHDITVIWKGEAGKININGTDYKLLQLHWHSPSEHTANGIRHKLELHVVHISAQQEIAVIAIAFKYGRRDSFLNNILHHIKRVGSKEKYLGIINPGDIKFDRREYFRYVGSLTIPPCTQGVVWTVINKVRTVSRGQVRALREAVHDGFESNARPTQSLDERPVLFYAPWI